MSETPARSPKELDLPPGMTYGDQGLVTYGVVARDLARHVLLPRPRRRYLTCIFDHLGGQTMTSIHLARVGAGDVKCDHRHLDETLAFMVSGSGFSEFRQDDAANRLRVDWGPGDLVVIPTNAYHRHVTNSSGPSRQLSFRNAPAMTTLLHGTSSVPGSPGAVYAQPGARFPNRFADEPDYFALREEVVPGVVRANFVPRIADEPMGLEDERFGRGVAVQRYLMGGQRILDVGLVDIRAGGAFRAHRPLAEESFVVLEGSGRTDLWRDGQERRYVEWGAGDLVVLPMGAWREHSALGTDPVRLLWVRNLLLTRVLGVEDDLDLPAPPDRLPHGPLDPAAGHEVPVTIDDEDVP